MTVQDTTATGVIRQRNSLDIGTSRRNRATASRPRYHVGRGGIVNVTSERCVPPR